MFCENFDLLEGRISLHPTNSQSSPLSKAVPSTSPSNECNYKKSSHSPNIESSDSQTFTIKSKNYKSNDYSLLKDSEINHFFKIKTLKILKSIYPKTCNCNNPNLLFLKVKNRDSIARCSNCHKMVSITAKTPFENYRSNLAYISFIIWDMINQYPKIMTSKEISRKLNLSYKTSFYLKKRLQVIFSQLNETLKTQLYEELKNPVNTDKKPIAVADSVVLFSASLRANKHRSRRYKTGTASIYLSNSLGGGQCGTLVHTVGINGGMTFYKSIPLNNQEYLEKDLDDKIPKNATLYTDEGYTFLWDRPNHKSVNHSRKSNDPRYNLSRERWVTKEGVSSNGAEARNNLLKQSFRSYGYVSPKWSQLYLDEISLLGNVRFSPEMRGLLIGGEEWDLWGKGTASARRGTRTPTPCGTTTSK